MKMAKIIFWLCLAIGWNIAHANTCTTITPQISTLSVGTINVQRDAPVGSVVFSQAATTTGSYLTGCTNPLMLGRVRISTLRNENETFSQLNSITYIGVFLRLVTYSHLP